MRVEHGVRLAEIAAVAALLLVAVGTRPGDGGAASATGATVDLACAEATRVAPGRRARLGPLGLRVSTPAGRAQLRFAAGYATKVVLVRLRRFRPAIVLRGTRCADGVPLRFAYDGERLPAPPLSRHQLETSGSPAARLRPYPHDLAPGTSFSYTGYILFSDVGRYRITASQGTRRIAALVVDVVPIEP